MNLNPSPAGNAGTRRLGAAGLAACVAVFAVTLSPAPAADRMPSGQLSRGSELKKGDRAFFEQAAKASMAQVAISRIAAARTSNQEVRRFAQKMVEDHERSGEELSAIARRRGIELPAKDPHPDKWEKRDAKRFDQDYLDQMVSDHEDIVKRFDEQARDGQDADAVAYAREHLPKLQSHLQHALDLKRVLAEKRAAQ